MMAPATTTYQSNEKKQEETVYDGYIQQINPFYPAMNINMPDMPPSHSAYHPANWQCEPNDTMWMEVLQSWPTNSVMNAPAPVMSQWQANTMPAWNIQDHNSINPQPVTEGLSMYSPSTVGSDSTFQPSPVRYEESFSNNNTWNGGWVKEVQPAVEGVMSSVEAVHDSMTIDIPVPVSVPVQAQAQAPRRRRAPTPTIDLPSYVTPTDEAPVQQMPVRAGKRRRAPTPTIDFDEYFTPALEQTPIPQAPIVQPTYQPTALVRPATARRESAAKARRGSHTVFKTQSANSKRGHYASDVWEGHKATIKKLYIDDGKPLRELIRIMEQEHDFPAT